MYEPRASYVQSNQLETVGLTFIGYLKTRGEEVMAHSSHINFSENTSYFFTIHKTDCHVEVTSHAAAP